MQSVSMMICSDQLLLSNDAVVPGNELGVGNDGVDEVDEQGGGVGDRNSVDQGAGVGDRDAGDDDRGDVQDRFVAVAVHGVPVHG